MAVVTDRLLRHVTSDFFFISRILESNGKRNASSSFFPFVWFIEDRSTNE
jgi:hypothetical protein